MLAEVKLATESDAPLFESLAPDLFTRPIRHDLLEAFLEDPSHHMTIARAGSTLVGFASAVHHICLETPGELWLTRVAVTPMMRRQGIGRRLITRMFDHGAVLDCAMARALPTSATMGKFLRALGAVEDHHTPSLYLFEIARVSRAG